MKLHLAEGLSLPVDLATQTLLVVGKRGSGKSNTCVRLAEQLFKAKVPFVAVDPTDTWWGLKASKDGKGPGLGVYVFGGRRADLPLESTAGAMVADVVVDHRISAVLSVKHFSGRERGRFVSDFADRLFQRNTEPLHLFLEEAHEVAPQNPFKGEEEMLGRVNRIWKLGRSSGLGGSAITQRPASLSKNITTQAEILIVHRMLGPQDVAAIREWIKYHGESDKVLSQLAELKTGEAWLWAPDFPEGAPLGLRRVRILERETFNSSATPKAGERQVEPKALAPVDLEALKTRMAATIERAKAEDPKELRRRIAELERSLKLSVSNGRAAPAPRVEVQRVEIPALRSEDLARLEEACGRALDAASELREAQAAVARTLDEARQLQAQAARALALPAPPVQTSAMLGRRPGAPTRHDAPCGARSAPTGGLSGPQQRILDSLAWLESVRVPQAKKVQLALLAEASPTSSAYTNNLGTLRTAGLLEYPGPGLVQLTADGRRAARASERPPTTEELHASLFARLPRPQTRILQALIDVYPKPLEKALVAERAEASSTSSAYTNNLGALRSLGLIDYPAPGQVVANDVLFLD